ncbi:Ccr4-not transcription complex subunit [Thalictrum thalictroides]|uniref:poly(A)-specific ribonuclease n=1 Tax=Thalictrum thalictroides TaxID=46969 RepID=A0A7J6X3R7_THATH|nr:Ccr4-not transcription complex subunit [Thalictrum thalictroides]
MEMIKVRKVWSNNLVQEVNYIKKLLPHHPFVSFDTKFPGIVELYESVKRNVNATNIIQIGITLSNEKTHHVWEFNFKDFDLSRGDLHSPESIKLLRSQGIDFNKNAKDGIASQEFVYLMLCSGLLRNNKHIWIGFHIGYD